MSRLPSYTSCDQCCTCIQPQIAISQRAGTFYLCEGNLPPPRFGTVPFPGCAVYNGGFTWNYARSVSSPTCNKSYSVTVEGSFGSDSCTASFSVSGDGIAVNGSTTTTVTAVGYIPGYQTIFDQVIWQNDTTTSQSAVELRFGKCDPFGPTCEGILAVETGFTDTTATSGQIDIIGPAESNVSDWTDYAFDGGRSDYCSGVGTKCFDGYELASTSGAQCGPYGTITDAKYFFYHPPIAGYKFKWKERTCVYDPLTKYATSYSEGADIEYEWDGHYSDDFDWTDITTYPRTPEYELSHPDTDGVKGLCAMQYKCAGQDWIVVTPIEV